MLKSSPLTKLFGAAVCTLILSSILPTSTLGQRRWREVRSRRATVVVNYRPRSFVVYQRPHYGNYVYGYQPYYTTGYYNYGYRPYYTRYYSYRYSQPYFANRYTYSWANPTYAYRVRHRRSGLRIGIRLR